MTATCHLMQIHFMHCKINIRLPVRTESHDLTPDPRSTTAWIADETYVKNPFFHSQLIRLGLGGV